MKHTQHVFALVVWGHAPRKIIKISPLSFNLDVLVIENYEAVKLMVGG